MPAVGLNIITAQENVLHRMKMNKMVLRNVWSEV